MVIRGHTETEGNLYQLLMIWASDDADLKCWLQENKYMSHDPVNEQIKIMSLSILRTLLEKIKACSPTWYAIIGDEATDAANREQLNLSLWWVNDNYEVSEDAVGLFSLPNTTADTIFTVIEDILSLCSLPLSLCRGHAFDGAANMQGKRKGVSTRIWKENPAAIVVHCYAQCLNLYLHDAGRKLDFLHDALDIVKEVAKLIKFSPKRFHLFLEKLEQPDCTGVAVKALCTTRWTARTEAIAAVLKDYLTLLELMEEIYCTTHDEYSLKAHGIFSELEKFDTLFGLSLGHLLFGASESLSKSLQAKDTSLQEGLSAVNLCKAFYDRQRKEESFNCLYDKVLKTGQDLKIDPLRLPYYRRAPVINEDGSFPHWYSTPREYFRHQYYKACDLLHQDLENRFSQTGLLLPLLALESLLLNASNGLSFQE